MNPLLHRWKWSLMYSKGCQCPGGLIKVAITTRPKHSSIPTWIPLRRLQ
uniref:Uncharacterized protein n=1 Tax=Anguilla anguilla TaxID=7936 RepID=A0A0E9VGL6_ANGAN